MEEAVTTNPQTGEEIVSLLRSSVADHLIVGIVAGVDEGVTRKILEENGYRVRAVEPNSYMLAELTEFTDPSAQTKAIQDLNALNQFIDFAEPDYVVHPSIAPNDPAYSSGKMWGLHNPGTAAGSMADADIDAPEAWALRTGAPEVVVAVIDSGIQYNHEDLNANMWQHPTNGSYGFDAYDNDDDPMDLDGHGTHCSGTIGAVGYNSKGTTGVAWDVQLMAIRFLSANFGVTSDAIRSINYSRLNGAHIISASWGGAGYSQSLFNAIQACEQAGIPFVSAAGNSSANNDSIPFYPSSYNISNIVAVASTTESDTLSFFSSYGKYSVDIAAPGSSIWSTYVGGNNSYTYLNGTSMATPHISGALALAMAHFPEESSDDVIARLYDSVDRVPALNNKVGSGGRVNLNSLLNGVRPTVSNDNFTNAYRFEADLGEWSGSSQHATREPDEDDFSVPGSGLHSLWFALRTNHGGIVKLDARSNLTGYRFIVFEGSEKGSLRMLYDFPNGAVTTETTFSFNAKPDTEYRVLLDDLQPNGQSYTLKYTLSPANDFFSTASLVSGDSFFVEGTNRGATQELFEQTRPHAGLGKGNSVWWRWTAPENIDFTINTMESDFDTVLAVYTGSDTSSLTEISSNDDQNGLDWTSQVGFSAVAGTTYHIAVDGYRADSKGEINLRGFRSNQLTILRQPKNLQVAIGKRAVFDVSVLTGGDPLYQWFFNDKAIPGQTSANLVIDPVRNEDFGGYKVEVRNSENQVVSETAVLSEILTPPVLVWTSGNQAVATGTAVTLAADFSGSRPLTYSWTKNGLPISVSNEPSLVFPTPSTGDAGSYRLTATNSTGTAFTDFQLTVLDSPWERWEWRRKSITNAAITDIKVYGSEAFAVSGTVLFRSTDGINWSKSVFPQGFTATSIAKNGTALLCIGLTPENQFRVTTSSDNGVTWTIAETTGYPLPPFQPEKYSLISFGNAFIAYSPSGEEFFRSTNGTSWTSLTGTDFVGQNVNLRGNGNIATDGTKLILASKTAPNDYHIRYYFSTDGISWTEQEKHTNVYSAGELNTACYAMGRFYFFGHGRIYTSSDAIGWNNHVALNNNIAKNSLFATNGDTLFAFEAGSESLRYFSKPDSLKSRGLLPANSHAYTAAATFGGKVLYGTDKGLLGLAQDPFDIVIPNEKASILQSIEFTEDLFIARTTNPTSISVPDQISGDGVTWKQNNLLDTPQVLLTGSAFGKYYGMHFYSNPALYSGSNPFDVRESPNDNTGLPANVSFIGQFPNGNALAVTSSSGAPSKLHARVAGAAAWSSATFPQFVGGGSKYASLGNRWYSRAGTGADSGVLIYTSTNGTTWESTGLTGGNPHFVNFGGKSWCISQKTESSLNYTTRAAYSTDGVSWTDLGTTGLPSSRDRFGLRVFPFGSYLVLLGADQNLYFSENGTTWIRGFTPGKVVDIATGNGQLVALMSNGGIIQTGAPHPGGSAPLVSIISPQTASTHLLGSQLTVEGTVSDPEEGAVSYDCYMDTQFVASGTGTTFRFTVTPTDPQGHTVTVRARDSYGLRQMDTVRLRLSAAEPENLLANTGGGAVTANHAIAFDGVFYAAGSRTLRRSFDGKSWEKVQIPSFANSISGMASGSGALVIQFDNGAIMSTRDGVNWTHFSPNLTNYRVSESVRFSAGRFVAAYNDGNGRGSAVTSSDGLRWEIGTFGEDGYISWTANGNDGTIIGAAGSGFGVRRTLDNGFNWRPIDSLYTSSPYNSHGIFADDRYVVAISGSDSGANKLFLSSDALTWSEHPLPGNIAYRPHLTYLGGLYFLGGTPNYSSGSPYYSHVSMDAVNWHAMSHGVNSGKITHSRGLFIAQENLLDRILTSRDGITWKAASSTPAKVSKILSNEEEYLMITEDGAVWTSSDGVSWENTLPGGAQKQSVARIGQDICQLNGRIVSAGSRLLMTSQDNGRTWANATINGADSSADHMYEKAVSSGSEILAFQGDFISNITLLRSSDGISFSTVTGLPAKRWADFAWNGLEWMLIATDGSLLRSNNGGLSWTQLNTSGIAQGAGVVWFANRWVIIGATTPETQARISGFTLGSSDVLQNHGNISFLRYSSGLRTLVGHGKLFIWYRGETPFVTSNGISWLASNAGGSTTAGWSIYHTPEGFTAIRGSFSPFYPVQGWIAGPDGLAWRSMPPPFNAAQYARNLGERVFIFSENIIAEVSYKDLALTLPSFPTRVLGVGDSLATSVTITNFGRTIPVNAKWRINAWLAKNRFFGDTKNIPIGNFDLSAPMPAPGASAAYPVSFTLPNKILTGDNYLILSLSPSDDVIESNTANNTVICAAPAIQIPEWEFNVATNGSGRVNMDFAATRYPHKSRISLAATAGKGATFIGWGGDANSPNNQITVLMDGNKNLQANFSDRANLQVIVRGLGNVTGLADLGSYAVNQTAQVAAAPALGWAFSHWSGAIDNPGTTVTILMDQPKAVTAHFVQTSSAWKASCFSTSELLDTAVSGNNADPDGDGVLNWQEYLHGSNPKAKGSTGIVSIGVDNEFLRCVYTRHTGASNGAAINCQAGRRMNDWDSPELEERIISTADGVETIEARLPRAGHARGFMRFRYDPGIP